MQDHSAKPAFHTNQINLNKLDNIKHASPLRCLKVKAMVGPRHVFPSEIVISQRHRIGINSCKTDAIHNRPSLSCVSSLLSAILSLICTSLNTVTRPAGLQLPHAPGPSQTAPHQEPARHHARLRRHPCTAGVWLPWRRPCTARDPPGRGPAEETAAP